jgi:hypothetical protein
MGLDYRELHRSQMGTVPPGFHEVMAWLVPRSSWYLLEHPARLMLSVECKPASGCPSIVKEEPQGRLSICLYIAAGIDHLCAGRYNAQRLLWKTGGQIRPFTGKKPGDSGVANRPHLSGSKPYQEPGCT